MAERPANTTARATTLCTASEFRPPQEEATIERTVATVVTAPVTVNVPAAAPDRTVSTTVPAADNTYVLPSVWPQTEATTTRPWIAATRSNIAPPVR